MTRQDRITQMARVMATFSLFCRETLGYTDMTPEHAALCDFLQAEGRKKLVLMPRYSFKSSIATVGYALWRLTRDDSLRILVYSDTTTKAEGFLTSIKNHLLGSAGNGRFRELFGAWEVDPKQGVWNQSAIVIKPRKQAHVEPNVDTGGIETSKVGLHYDLILFDDLVSDKNVTTPEQMEKAAECYQKALSLLKPGGQIVMTGTRWHFGDLYGRLLAENAATQAFQVHHRQAITEDGAYPFASIGLTAEFLAEQRHVQGSYMFSSLYQNNPVDDETATFKAQDFRFYAPLTPAQLAELSVTCTLDPATGEGADDAALTVVGTDADGTLYVLDLVAGKLLPDAQIEAIITLYYKWRFHTMGLETNAFQKVLKRALEARVEVERRRSADFRLFHIHEFTGTSATSKQQRIQGLQPYHERGALRLPGERLETLTGLWQKLSLQMLQFPRAPHDDLLDSLAYHVPIHRKGAYVQTPDTVPYRSAAWAALERRKQQVLALDQQPRWQRPVLVPLHFN